jgi:hypothetical protein
MDCDPSGDMSLKSTFLDFGLIKYHQNQFIHLTIFANKICPMHVFGVSAKLFIVFFFSEDSKELIERWSNMR